MSINIQENSPRLPPLLNPHPKENQHNPKPFINAIKDYLPTPVTPSSDFPLLKESHSPFTTFSILQSPPFETKVYPCPECHHTFSRPHNLKSHLTTHSTERPFQCDMCHYHFRRHHDLKRHQKLHTGERPFMCDDCHRSFARLDALHRHRKAEGGTACTLRPPSDFRLPPITSPLDRLLKENQELKKDIDYLRTITQRDSNQLQSRIHDLEIQNKLLRSLIQKSSQN